MKRILFTILLLISYIFIYSQEYNWKGKLEEVSEEGYYKIYLSPEITSQLNHSFPDIRIVDENKNEIQYILKKQKKVFDKGKRNELKIIKNKHKKFKHYTEIIIENSEAVPISNFVFEVVNIHNPVYIKFFGSQDLKRWYVLKNSFPVVPEITDADSTEFRVMDIPESKFKYYKVYFHDFDERPIEVGHVYFHDLADIRAEYEQLPPPSITQIDSLNRSIVQLKFSSAQFIDMITFGIKGPEYYLRQVNLQKTDTVSLETAGDEYYDQYKKEFYFGSLMNNRIHLHDFKAKKIELIIDNKDNQALQVYKANAYQLKNFLIAWLKPDTKYTLWYGSETASFPSYDLPYFIDTIPENLPQTYIYNIQKSKKLSEQENRIWTFPAKYLWIIIGFTAVILLLISVKLMLERFKK
jgi:hypothetical protein